MIGQAGNTPILVLKEGTRRERGKGAQYDNIAAAKAIADAVRTTLGPRGMDKMLVGGLGDVTITNDGVTILKELEVEHPAAKMIIEVAKTQDEEAGDGTTTSVILAGEFLKKAEALIEQNVHPTVITKGFRMAESKAIDALEKISLPVGIKDKETLIDIAKTSMYSKSASSSIDVLAKVSVEAVSAVAEERDGRYYVDDDDIQLVKKHGASIDETETIKGIIVDKEAAHTAMPKHVEKAKIALLDAALEIKKTEIDAKIEITDPTKIQQFLAEEENMLRGMVEKVKGSGANVVFCQKGIDDLASHYLSKSQIYAVKRVKKSDMEKLSKATGANIISRVDDLTAQDLGNAQMVEERKILEDKMTFVTGCKNPKAVSILIRGGTEHVVDEIERSLVDATSVVSVALEDGKMAYGGGATATELAMKLRDYATSVGGREQIAIEAYAEALEVIPTTLAENAGLDPIDILIDIRKAHKNGQASAGVNVISGKVTDMKREKIIEPIRVGKQAIHSATDAAVMILKIDDVIASKAKDLTPPKGGPGGMGGMGDEY